MRNLNTQKNIAVACAIALSAVVASTPAMAKKSETEHLRGVITASSDTGFTVKTEDGQMRKIALSSKTKIAAASKGDLSNIEKGTFIGTANVDKDGENHALEMVIFPPSMKGTGLGDYGWDLTPSMANKSAKNDASASSQGSKMAGSSMTNGTVTSKSNGSMTAGSSMTNGTVESKTAGSMTAGSGSAMSGSSMTNGTVTKSSNDDKMLTLNVNYGKGSKTIHVPADVPTVKVEPGKKTDIVDGAHVFVAGPQGTSPFKAAMVIVGKNGTVPPM